eukprot:2809579-Rhodomonas_salina.1
MSGTELACGTSAAGQPALSAPVPRPEAPYGISLRACSMSGTDAAYGVVLTSLRWYTDIAYAATACYAMSGTDVACAATACYAMSGTDV